MKTLQVLCLILMVFTYVNAKSFKAKFKLSTAINWLTMNTDLTNRPHHNVLLKGVFLTHGLRRKQVRRRSKRWMEWLFLQPQCIPPGDVAPNCGAGCGYCCNGKCQPKTSSTCSC